MAYATNAKVAVFLGATDLYWTSTIISAVIVESDVWVDIINSGASAAKKELASSILAAHIARAQRTSAELEGLTSTAGAPPAEPGKSGNPEIKVPKVVYEILGKDRPAPTFSYQQPNSVGEFI